MREATGAVRDDCSRQRYPFSGGRGGLEKIDTSFSGEPSASAGLLPGVKAKGRHWSHVRENKTVTDVGQNPGTDTPLAVSCQGEYDPESISAAEAGK